MSEMLRLKQLWFNSVTFTPIKTLWVTPHAFLCATDICAQPISSERRPSRSSRSFPRWYGRKCAFRPSSSFESSLNSTSYSAGISNFPLVSHLQSWPINTHLSHLSFIFDVWFQGFVDAIRRMSNASYACKVGRCFVQQRLFIYLFFFVLLFLFFMIYVFVLTWNQSVSSFLRLHGRRLAKGVKCPFPTVILKRYQNPSLSSTTLTYVWL